MSKKTHDSIFGSVFTRFTGKHLEIKEILAFVIKFFNFSLKVDFFRLGFLDIPLFTCAKSYIVLCQCDTEFLYQYEKNRFQFMG